MQNDRFKIEIKALENTEAGHDKGDKATMINNVFSPNNGLAFFGLGKSWEIISVKRSVGLKDKHNREIFEGERFLFRYQKELDEILTLEGCFTWSEDELRYEINVFNNEGIPCLSYLSNGVMFDFELIEK